MEPFHYGVRVLIIVHPRTEVPLLCSQASPCRLAFAHWLTEGAAVDPNACYQVADRQAAGSVETFRVTHYQRDLTYRV